MSEGTDPMLGKTGKAKRAAEAKTKTRSKRATATKRAAARHDAREAAESKASKVARPDVVGGQQLPPLAPGYMRFVTDLPDRFGEWLVRYSALLSQERRQAMTPPKALEHIVRHTYANDPTKGGRFMGAKTQPYSPGEG